MWVLEWGSLNLGLPWPILENYITIVTITQLISSTIIATTKSQEAPKSKTEAIKAKLFRFRWFWFRWFWGFGDGGGHCTVVVVVAKDTDEDSGQNGGEE